jgi:hypothetical protein
MKPVVFCSSDDSKGELETYSRTRIGSKWILVPMLM